MAPELPVGQELGDRPVMHLELPPLRQVCNSVFKTPEDLMEQVRVVQAVRGQEGGPAVLIVAGELAVFHALHQFLEGSQILTIYSTPDEPSGRRQPSRSPST